MKNATQIITSIQYKPQYSKLLEHKCIHRLKSSLLASIQNYIKYGYIKNNILTYVVGATLDKHDIKNTVEMIKLILQSPMLLESENFFECLDVQIDDVRFVVDHKPKQIVKLHSTDSYKLLYKERATGDIEVNIKDKKLNELSLSIMKIIKAKHDA